MRYLFLFVLLAFFSCTDEDMEAIEVRQTRMAEISAEVDAVIANKSCNGADDCATIAWGAKPCGGPWGYLVYAPGNVDVPRLQDLVEEYNQLEHEVNQLTNALSDCALVEDPELICADNVCSALE